MFCYCKIPQIKRLVKFCHQQRRKLKRYIGRLLLIFYDLSDLSILFIIQIFNISSLIQQWQVAKSVLKFHETARFKNESFAASIATEMFPRFLHSNVLQVEITYFMITEKVVNCLKIPRVISIYYYGVFVVSHWSCVCQGIPHWTCFDFACKSYDVLNINCSFFRKITPNVYSDVKQLLFWRQRETTKRAFPSRRLLCSIYTYRVVHCSFNGLGKCSCGKCCIWIVQKVATNAMSKFDLERYCVSSLAWYWT